MNRNKGRKSDKIIIFILVILLVISEIAIFLIARNKDEKDNIEYEPVDMIGTYETEDNVYFQKLSKKLVLLTGLNKDDAQYILLIAVDEDNKIMQPIQINRDVLCEYNVLDQFGKITGKEIGPIRNSYKGASDALVRLVNVKDTVSKLMCNARVDYYMSINLLAGDKITEIYDGIDVQLSEDYTDINPNYVKGTYITIYPEDAINFLVGDEAKEGSKKIEERINTYLNGFYDLNQYEYQNDSNYFSKKFAEVTKYCLFNSNEFIDYTAQTIWYKHLPIITVDSSDAKELEKICLDTIYK